MENSVTGRAAFRAFGWFFAALSLLALLSPPGATHDEWYHAGSIWCGHGVRPPYCQEIGILSGQYLALTNLDAKNCQVDIRAPLYCPTPRVGLSRPLVNDGLYPPGFYFVLSWSVLLSSDAGIVLTRAASALIICSVLAVLFWALPRRHQVVLFLMILTSFSTTGYYLFASINPSSWAALGVGVAWLAIHAALLPGTVKGSKRLSAVLVGAIAALMAAGSRWDSFSFLSLSIVLTLLHVALTRFPNRQRTILSLVIVGVLGSSILLELVIPFAPLENLRRLGTFTAGQRDNVAFFSEYLLQGLPNALRALGTVPTMSGILLPEIIYVGNLMILGTFLLRSFHRTAKIQVIGFAVVSVMISFVIMAQVALTDNRDSGGVEPRYIYPLLVFLVGWWYLTGPEDLQGRITQFLKPAAIVSVLLFALMAFTVAERFVDHQTSGLRLLPEGPDQWWWSWMPVGPNVIVILAPLFLWLFFREILKLLGSTSLQNETV